MIREALNRRASKIIAPAPSGEWAPCMVALRNRVADAGHFGLFSLAAYMANRGYDVNSIVDVLRVRSDFDERIARYQVEHIAGLRGSRVKYKPELPINEGPRAMHRQRTAMPIRYPKPVAV